MKLSHSSSTLIEDALRKAVERYVIDSESNIVTDIHLQPNQSSGELSIYDDDDTELASVAIEEWVSYEQDDFYGSVEHILSQLLRKMKEKGAFDKLAIMKPYSFVLVDDDKETVAELLLMDDDTLMLNDELLKGLDEELDAFLKDLLEK